MCQLYRHFDATGNLLYVGISNQTIVRLGQHKSSSWFREISRVEIEHCQTREYAEFLEAYAVRYEKPRCNRVQPQYDACSPTLTSIVVQEARNEAWVKAWAGEDVSGALKLCDEIEDPVAKATKGKTDKAGRCAGVGRIASRLGARRIAQDSPRLETAGAVAILKRGRPKKSGMRPWDVERISKRTWYRRKREAEKAK